VGVDDDPANGFSNTNTVGGSASAAVPFSPGGRWFIGPWPMGCITRGFQSARTATGANGAGIIALDFAGRVCVELRLQFRADPRRCGGDFAGLSRMIPHAQRRSSIMTWGMPHQVTVDWGDGSVDGDEPASGDELVRGLA